LDFDFTHTFSLSATNNVRIWIDWNNDFVFDDAEIVFEENVVSITKVGTISIPNATPIGNYRMRMRAEASTIFLEACSIGNAGQTLDFTLVVTEGAACMGVETLNISNATFISTDVSWTPAGTETLWDIQWGTGTFDPNTNTGTAMGSQNGLTTPNYSITGLTPATDYRIYVRADCGGGDTSVWKLSHFHSAYCVPTEFNYNGWSIGSFSTMEADIDLNYSTHTPSSYMDETHVPFSVAPGQSFDWSVSFPVYQPLGISNMGGFYIWIDWNSNMTFEPSELIFASQPPAQNSATGTIFVDAIQLPGIYRMRISSYLITWEYPIPCGPNQYGNYTDFNLVVAPSPSCNLVTTLSTNNTTSTSVDVSWTVGGTETLWDIQWGTETFDPNNNITTAIGSTTCLTTPNYSITGLTPNTDYKIFVRANCGTDTSFWKPINFRTGYCISKGITGTSSYYINSFSTSGDVIDLNYSTSVPIGYADKTV